MNAAERWRSQLDAWAIPDEILRAAPESPWGFPVELFDREPEPPRDTPSRLRALEALPDEGTVLDVGCGAGAAALALLPRAARVTGVDPSRAMLDAFARRASEAGAEHAEIEAAWPADAPAADVVVCHHVLYNVGDVEPFLLALDAHAGARVVVEVTASHPLAWMNPLWERFHGLRRPDGPTADDALAVLQEAGIDASAERFDARSPFAHADPDVRVAHVRRRLCLGPEHDDALARALEAPVPARELVTIWW